MPPGYRRHGVLWQQPAILAHMAQREIEASLNTARRCYSTPRTDLAEAGVDPTMVEKALGVYAEDGARRAELARLVGLLADALIRDVAVAGHRRHVPWEARRAPWRHGIELCVDGPRV